MNQTRATTHPIDYILERLCINLQISDSLHASAEESYNAVGKWLAEESDLATHKPGIYPQGSLKIGTTIRPAGSEEYDLDLVCEFGNINSNDVDPKKVLIAVYNTIKSNSYYSDITELKKRCVRINYKRQFHLDILPAVPNANDIGTCILVPDKQANGGVGGWKPSNPKGYAEWFEEQCRISKERLDKFAKIEPLPENETYFEKEPLKCVVQLLKRWRNNVYKDNEQAPVSIVLTTLAATYYQKEINLSDAMTTILNGINARNNVGYYEVINPTTSNPKEILSEKWRTSSESFNRFVIEFGSLTRMWNELKYDRGPALENRLSLIFGNNDGIIKKSYADYTSTISEMRKKESLSTSRSGLLSALGGGAAKVRPNTFHGE